MRFELADFEEALGNIVAAKEILLLALAEAEQTKDEQTIYNALTRLGSLCLNRATRSAFAQRISDERTGDLAKDCDEAIAYFQRAMKYSRAIWPYNLINLLDFLGMAWSYRPETLPMAVAMYDWICQIDPVPVDALEQKYKCLILLGEMENVKSEAAKKSFTSCIEAASTIAARHALGRRKRAISAAVEGLRLAQEHDNRRWLSYFDSLLNKRK